MKNKLFKKAVSMTLVSAMAFGMTACGNQNEQSSSVTDTPPADAGAAVLETETDDAPQQASGDVNYKGNVNYVDIANQLRADQTLDLNGLASDMFQITGYAQGYNFDDAWMGSITQMTSSGCEVVLASGSGDFAFNFGGVDRTDSEIKVGGVDSLTNDFEELLKGGVYTYCAGSYPSMIAPAYAVLFRALEGNALVDAEGKPAAIGMSHWVATSDSELGEIIAQDSEGSYVVDANVFSKLLTGSHDEFEGMTVGMAFEDMMEVKSKYSSEEKVELGGDYKIGVLLNDTTSPETLAYQAYGKYLAEEFGFTVSFSESTGGTPTEEVNQIQTWASAGYDAIISMSSGSVYDQANACTSNGMLLVMYAAHPTAEDQADLESLENYCGAVGPTTYNEAEAGYHMAKYYIEQGYTSYAVFGGSIAFGAETHAYRVAGMMAAMIEKETGVPCEDFN